MSFIDVSKLFSVSIENYNDQQVINSTERHNWQSVKWFNRWIHPQKSSSADRDFFQKIFSFFKEKRGVQSSLLFKKIWENALTSYQIKWKESDRLTVEMVKRIDAALKDTLLYQGQGIDTDCEVSDPEVHEIVHFLLGKGHPSLSWINKKNIAGLFLNPDPHLLHSLQVELQNILAHCGKHLPQVGSPEEIVFEEFVGQVIALFPFCYPVEGTHFMIPHKVDGVWRNISYLLDKNIQLTPERFSSPAMAYGFTSAQAPPFIVFLGTTFPSGEGFVATVLSDFTPGYSVGGLAYFLGQDKIADWMKDKLNVRAFGMSLGGALAFHLLRNYKDRLEQVHAYSPPGLYARDWTETYDAGPKINIVYQKGDLVPKLGFFPEGKKVFIYKALTGADGENVDPFTAHSRIFTGADQVTLLKTTAELENTAFSRKMLTCVHAIFSFIIFVPIVIGQLIFKIGQVAHAYFFPQKQPLYTRDLRGVNTVEDLESIDEYMKKFLEGCSSGHQKFSWSVFGEYYRLCKERGYITLQEQRDPDWGRHHFEHYPVERMRTLNTVFCQLTSKEKKAVPLLKRESLNWSEWFLRSFVMRERSQTDSLLQSF